MAECRIELQNAEVSDTTGDDSSSGDGLKNKLRVKRENEKKEVANILFISFSLLNS
ncbi:MAG: hypothetical protein J7502_16285 [Flavisolibacter sp.]|nr:hypothetical protein [Flavisolibacter sp.]